MTDIIRTIITMSISGGAIAVILFALKPLVRHRLPKSAQYYLWLVAIAALLVPVSLIVKLPAATPDTHVIPVPSNVVDRFVVASEPIQNTQEFMEVDNDRYTPVKQVKSPVSIVALMYLLGVLSVLLYYGINYSVFVRIHSRRNTEAKAEEIAMLTELCGNRRVPGLYRNPIAATPMLIGLFRPAVVLPDREYTDARLRAVLLHELTHLRRGDVLVKWLSVFACAVHWFNPVVWLVRREIDRACELSCDESVIRNLDANGKQNYGDTLLYVAADPKTPRAVLSTTMCEEKKALKERLGAIMRSKRHTRLAIALSAALIFAVSGAAIALGAGRAESVAESFAMYETTRVYHLENMTELQRLERFSSITLQPDGKAELAIPPISSYYPPDCTYAFKDGVLTIYYSDTDEAIASFKVLDENTLVLQSSNAALFADEGARYVAGSVGNDEPSPTVKSTASEAAMPILNSPFVDTKRLSYDLWTPYIGDASAVGKIVNALPQLDDVYVQRYFSVGDDYGTGKAPNTLTLYYEPVSGAEQYGRVLPHMSEISTLLFGLIDNLEEVNYAFRDTPSGEELDKTAYTHDIDYSRDVASEVLRSADLTWEDLKNDWNFSVVRLFAGFMPIVWLDYYNSEEMPWGGSKQITLPEYPGITFNWTPEKVTVTGRGREKTLFEGMPIWSIYFADLTKDGLPEICSTVSIGSGIIDTRIVAYDYANDRLYELSDRFNYDYHLSLKNGRRLVATQTKSQGGEEVKFGELLLNRDIGELVMQPLIGQRDAASTLHESFYEVVRKLYGMDNGLNDGIKYVAVDMAGVFESEREPLKTSLGQWAESNGLELLMMNADELAEAGYMTLEPIEEAGFHEGVLITFADAVAEDNSLTVRAMKYRGPLGAVGAEFTARFVDGHWVVDEPTDIIMA